MSVIINGEPVDASKFEEIDGKIKWVSEDGEVIEIDIDEGHREKDVRIIKKKILIGDDK